MHRDAQDVTDLAGALERQLEAQEEAAKRAIREYKKTIRDDNASGNNDASEAVHHIETRRKVEQAVNSYMQLAEGLMSFACR